MMSLYKESEDEDLNPDLFIEVEKEDEYTKMKKRKIKRLLEDRLEAKRLKEDLDDFEEDFDWSHFKS